MKRILITGGAGFIGSHTVDLFLQNHYHVTVIDNLSTGNKNNLPLDHPQLTFFEEDVLHYAFLESEIKKCDAVLHLAALPSVQKSIENPRLSLQVNTLGFVNVADAIRHANRAIRFVYASSAAVYGATTSLPCSDDMRLTDTVLSPYALEKMQMERYAELYAKLFNVSSLGLRYFNVYGLRQDPASPYAGVIAKFIELSQKNSPLVIFGDGMQSRDFVHVSDVARANYLAIESQTTGVLNIATGVPETLCSLVHYLENIKGEKTKVYFNDARPGDISQSYANVEKAKNEISFSYQISLEKGLQLLMPF